MYLSGYLKQHPTEYYRRLSAIHTDGDWESWVIFFLEGVATAAGDAEKNIIEIASLAATGRRRLLQSAKAGPASYRLFEMLPRFTIERVRQRLDTSFPTATAAVKVLEDLGVVTEMTGQKKNRSYSYQAYVELLSRRETPASPQRPAPVLTSSGGQSAHGRPSTTERCLLTDCAFREDVSNGLSRQRRLNVFSARQENVADLQPEYQTTRTFTASPKRGSKKTGSASNRKFPPASTPATRDSPWPYSHGA